MSAAVAMRASAEPSDPMDELNPQQLAAVQHGVGDEAGDTRALLVIAGAGSGKTNTLAHRVASLPWSGTFHSVGARLRREYAGRVGLDEAFTIQDRGDSQDLMALVRHETGLSASKSRFPMAATCLSIYSRVVNSGAPLAQVLVQVFPWCAQWEGELKRLFGAYVQGG